MQFRHHPEGDFGIGHGFQTISMNSWMGYSTVNTTYISDTGKSYDFNTATKKQ